MTWPPKPPWPAPQPVKKPRQTPEEDLQRAVVEYLDLALPPEAGVFWSATLNGIRVSKGLRGKLKEQGLRSGVPDLVFIPLRGPLAGVTHWIELKSAKGRPSSPEQAALLDVLYVEGRGCYARSVQEVQDALRRWGIPLRARL